MKQSIILRYDVTNIRSRPALLRCPSLFFAGRRGLEPRTLQALPFRYTFRTYTPGELPAFTSGRL